MSNEEASEVSHTLCESVCVRHKVGQVHGIMLYVHIICIYALRNEVHWIIAISVCSRLADLPTLPLPNLSNIAHIA